MNIADFDNLDHKNIWQSMEVGIKTIINNLNCSFFPLVNNSSGCDAVYLAKGLLEDGTMNECDLNIFAIELKDTRDTSTNEWMKKVEKLTSFRCIFPRLRSALKLQGKTLKYHIILIGREEDS